MNQAIRTALVGYGYAGKTFHAPLLVSVPAIYLSTVVSSDEAKVHADWPDVAVTDLDSVLADPEIELVVVATPNDTHFDIAKRALLAGKHVVVDKPFTVTVAEARELDALAHEQQRVLSVFHNRRWDADFLTVKRLLGTGELGDIVHFESHFDRFRPEVRQRWRESAAPGAGLWYDLGPHLIDQALQLFGPPEAVFADLATRRDGSENVDDAHVLLRYPTHRVVLHASMLVAGGLPRFSIHGKRASFVKYGLDTQEDVMKAGEMPGCDGWGEDSNDGTLFVGTAGHPNAETVPTMAGDYRQYYAAIAAAIGNEAANPVPASEAIVVMKILELAIESAGQRRELGFS
ncbi:oxidoreductase [Andreprevotia chitinilytica]|uniref:oxidoreductase n=1 Tax=Andreprevotia chitinilytica TaxID=396808 RepID=UPI0005520D38|nr:oxidoreductase [Andreprevotia chitinilytica]